MPFEPPWRVAHDHLAVAGERDRLDGERGLFAHFADDRLEQRLAGFDDAARQRVEVERRLARAAYHQHLAVADDGGADGEIGTLRIGARVGHAIIVSSIRRRPPAARTRSFSADSPLIIAPARAISGFNQAMAFPARAATVSGRRSMSSIAARVASARSSS